MSIYASDLMTAARENPQKYAGKRYGVVCGCAAWSPAAWSLGIEHDHKLFRTVAVSDSGFLMGIEDGELTDYVVAVTSFTRLEEIKSEPKPVTFMEAAKAKQYGKAVYSQHKNGEFKTYYYKGNGCDWVNTDGMPLQTGEVLYYDWYIVEE